IDPRPIAHARATLDVRLAALAAGLSVETERELPYTAPDGNDGVLRPDNLITLPDGTRALFETEQAADLTLLRRIVEGVRRKAAFFQSEAARALSPAVRVLINLPRGPVWGKTVRVWERATAIVAEEQGGDLPFRLLAMPLLEFLDRPDWFEPPEEARWEPLFDPAQTSTFEPPVPSLQGKPLARRKARLPRSLRRRAPADDRRILLAYWQHLLEQGPDLAYTADRPRPDPAFFEVVGVIYAASHGPDAPVAQQAAYPYASVYLLRKYLQMHPRLRQALSKGMVRGGGSMRWNVTTILHRMQVVIETFLRYHGYRVGRAVEAVPVSPWDRTDGPRDFGVAVRIHPEVLIGEEDGVVPGREEVRAAEEALAWVLWALFAHAEEVGLRRPPFW
ncbi:MAG TPA: hypothetical protein G4O00_12335, partial [Thermoflexia bacterium]|nr:hypothetical protein [Thermoflexia bacterium]